MSHSEYFVKRFEYEHICLDPEDGEKKHEKGEVRGNSDGGLERLAKSLT